MGVYYLRLSSLRTSLKREYIVATTLGLNRKNEEGVDHEISHTRGLLYVHEKKIPKKDSQSASGVFSSHTFQ